MESFEKTPELSPEQLRAYIGELLLRDDADVISDTLLQIGLEIKSMYSSELLKRSRYWHALSTSTIKDSEEILPASTENGVGRVIEDLLERRLKPML